MIQPYHLQEMQLCTLNILRSQPCSFSASHTLQSNVPTCHLHGVAVLACLACTVPTWQEPSIHWQDVLPSAGVVCISVLAHVGRSLVANAYTLFKVSLFP